jgi:hypothetical protein
MQPANHKNTETSNERAIESALHSSFPENWQGVLSKTNENFQSLVRKCTELAEHIGIEEVLASVKDIVSYRIITPSDFLKQTDEKYRTPDGSSTFDDGHTLMWSYDSENPEKSHVYRVLVNLNREVADLIEQHRPHPSDCNYLFHATANPLPKAVADGKILKAVDLDTSISTKIPRYKDEEF